MLVYFDSGNLSVVNCEKCLRSVGLWLYQTEPNLFDDKKLKQESRESQRPLELLAQLSHIEASYLSEVHPYSNELVIENLLKNMVKCVEVTEQAELKQQQQQSSSLEKSKKRKATDEKDSAASAKRHCVSSNGDESSRRAIDNGNPAERTKLFDPLSEHFSYCPWLKAEHVNFSNKRNICQLHYDIIKRYLNKLERKDQNANRGEEENKSSREEAQEDPSLLIQLDDSVLRAKYKATASFTSEEITNRIKSVQSLLINCTSQCSFGQMSNKTN